MNEFPLVAAVLLYIPAKAALLLICGFAVIRAFRLELRSTSEALALSFSLGFAVIYVLMLPAFFGGFFSPVTCLVLACAILVSGGLWAAAAARTGGLAAAIEWSRRNDAELASRFMPRPFYWLVAGSLLVLAILTAAVPSLDFEVFRWLRPVNSALQNGGFTQQPEEIMFWLPQTAQLIDGFTLGVTGEISFVTSDRILALVAIFFALQALSLRVFTRDYAPLAFLILIANENGSYLIPHAFLKGHLMGAVFGLSAILLYLTSPAWSAASRVRLATTGVLMGIAASVTFHSVFLPAAIGLHALGEFIVQKRRNATDERWRGLLTGCVVMFVPAALFAGVWIARNVILTGHATYPYGIYFPESGSFGTEDSFVGYILAHAALAKPLGYAHTAHAIGPFLAAGFVISIVGWAFVREDNQRRFLVLSAFISLIAFFGSYLISNISPRYYMYWVAILALCAAVPLGSWTFSNARRPIVQFASSLVLLVAAVIGAGYFTLRPSLDQVATGAAVGDFRRVTPQPDSIVAYANEIALEEPDATWATPLIMGADYDLATSNVVSYGWPTFPTALRLLSPKGSAGSYEALTAENIDYVMFFSIMPSDLYAVYDWDAQQERSVRIPYGAPHQSQLQRTLAVFETDEKGRLLRFDNRYLDLLFVSASHCAYLDKSGCLGGDASREPHFLFKVRDVPVEWQGWIEIATLPQVSE